MQIDVSTWVAIAALIFAGYQWSRTRGRVRVDLTQAQDRIYLRVTSQAPTDVVIDGFMLIATSGRFARIRQLVSKYPMLGGSFKDRLKSVVIGGRYFFFDRLAANMTVIPWPNSNHDKNPEPQDLDPHTFNPMTGPGLPYELKRYHGVSWAIAGGYRSGPSKDFQGHRTYYDDFDALARHNNTRMRFLVRVSGHPRRTIASKWLNVSKLEMLQPNEAWLRPENRPPPLILSEPGSNADETDDSRD
jgi:hypothetical protein